MNAVVNCHDELRWIEKRRIMMWNMQEIHTVPAHAEKHCKLPFPEGLFIR